MRSSHSNRAAAHSSASAPPGRGVAIAGMPRQHRRGGSCSTLRTLLARLAAAAQPVDHGVVGLHHLIRQAERPARGQRPIPLCSAKNPPGKPQSTLAAELPCLPLSRLQSRPEKSRPQMAGSTLLMVSQLPRLGGASVISAGTAPERTWSAPRQACRPAQRRIAPLCRSPLKPPHHPVH